VVAAPARAEIPPPPDVATLLQDYRGDTTVTKGEAFDASPANIDHVTQRIDLPGGLKLSLMPKKRLKGLSPLAERLIYVAAALGAAAAGYMANAPN
jgi:hypothetical protein